MVKIPAKMAVLFDEFVLEAVNLFDADLAFIDPAKDVPAA